MKTLVFSIFLCKVYFAASNITYNSLCVGKCSCGTFTHPIGLASDKVNEWVVPYPSLPTDNPRQTDTLIKWIEVLKPSVALTFPARVVFCTGLNLKRMPKKQGHQKTPPIAFNGTVSNITFVPQISALFLRQGHLEEVRYEDLINFQNKLEFVDLSHNRISYLSNKLFVDLPHLQEIDLRFNRLRTLGETSFLAMDVSVPSTDSSFQPFRPVVRLRGNQIQCSCSLARLIVLHVIIPLYDSTSCVMNQSKTGHRDGLFHYDLADRKSLMKISKQLCDFSKAAELEQLSIEPKIVSAEFHRENADTKQIPHDVHRDLNKWVMRSLSPSQKHHIADAKLNISIPHGGAGESYEGHADEVHRLYKRNGEVDIPLLVTMAIWFLMIYFSVARFVRVNALEREQHISYLIKLHKQQDNPLNKRNER